MTSACTFLTEEQFRCSICLDIFTDPVSIPCGHNFCKKCITHQWDVIDRAECPMCKTVSIRSPELHVNTFISEMAAKFRRSTSQTSRRLSVRTFSNSGEILCDVCTQTKAKAVKSCLMCLTTYCEAHLEPHYRIPGLKRHELIDPVESLEEKMCRSHGKPLEFFCETDQMCVCQKCINLDHKPHRVVPLEEEYERRKTGVGEKEAEIQMLIEERRLKIQKIREKVKLGRKNADREKTSSVQVFSALIQNVENDLAQLLVVIEEKQKATEEQAEGFITELEDEISELETISSEVAMLSHTNDPLQFLQDLPSLNAPAPVKSWKDIQVHASFKGTLRRAVAQLEKRLGQEVENMLRSELKRAQMYAVDVTLDPDTANFKLILKNNGKQVSYSNLKQNLPENPKRFSTCACVLGKESFSEGRFYFEVQVKDKTKWEVGVARESINRKGHITPSPKNGFWAITGSSVLLSLQFKPERVGVFVDYEEGTVFFYDVDTAALIYSFSGCCFVGKLHPYFRPCNLDNGKNTAPLIISTVAVTESKV